MGFHLWQALVVHWPQSPQTDGLGQRPVMMMMTGSPFSSSNPILLVKCERKWIPSFPSTLRISCVIAPVRDLYSSSLSLSSITSLLPLQWLQIPFPDELERQDERERARRRNCLVGEKEKEDPFSRALIAFSSSLPPRDFNSNCVVFDPFPHSSRRAVKIGAIKWTLWRWRQEKWKNQFDCHRRKCGNSLSLSLVASNRNRKLIIFLRSVCRLCRSSAPLTSTAPTLFFFFFPPLFPDDQKNRKKDKR